MKKSMVIAMVACMALTLVAVTFQKDRDPQDLFDHGIKGIAPFETKASQVSFDELIKGWSEKDVELYLPKNLPKKIKPVCVWVEVDSKGNIGNLALFLYDSEENDTIASAELVIEVSFRIDIPFDSETAKGTFTKINDWDAYIDENAQVSWKEYKDTFNTTSSILVDVQIGQLNYWFRGSPNIEFSDLVKTVESMEKVSG